MLLRTAVFAKGLTDLVKPFALEQCCYPIDQTVNYRCRYTIYNHRTGNLENFGTYSKHESFGLEFHCRGGDGVGEAGDGDKGSRAAEFGDVVVEAQAGQ